MIDILGLEDVWKEARKVREFCIGVMGVPLALMYSACVKELGRTIRKEIY